MRRRASLRGPWRAILSLLVVTALGIAAVPALAQTVTVPPTNAALPGNQFQGGDGNQDNATGLIDWQGLEANGRVGHTSDPQANDNIFTGGKELAPEDWTLGVHDGGATPASGNVLDIYRAFEHPDGGDAFLYIAFTRGASNGTIFVTFELNQKARTWTNSQGVTIPCRTTGDILISFDNSGNTADVQVDRWVTDTTDPATGCAKTGHLEAASALTPNVDVQASFNYSSAITNHLPGFYGASIPVLQFGEAAINLSRVMGGLDEPCAVFGSTWMHSRSSLSPTSDMKDYVIPEPFHFRTCKAEPSLRSSASGKVNRRARTHPLRRRRVLSGSLTISDTATLTGGDNPTGTITFKLYGPDDVNCSNRPVFTDTVTADDNGSYRSGSFTPTQVGTYRWVVDYSGDDNNRPAGPTGCGEDTETVTIKKPNPTLTSTASGLTRLRRTGVGALQRDRFRIAQVRAAQTGSVRATQPIVDSADLEGGFNPTGTITFDLYGPDDPTCSGTPLSTSRRDVTGNGTYNSAPFSPTHAGAYRWVVTYSGDANNNPAGPTPCGDASETIEVSPAQPGIVTVASPATDLGNPITDSATLTRGANPTGTITFKVYGPNDADCSGDAVDTSTADVHGNDTYTSREFTPTEPGLYRWVARYSGDSDNAGVATSCNDPGEDVSVGAPPPVQQDLSTTASPAHARAGSRIRDIAHLSGGADPTGSITFELFGPDNSTCASPAAFISSVPVSGDGDYTSRAFRPREVGTYHWVARYSGDDGNKPVDRTACDDAAETVTVSQATPQISTVARGSALVGHRVRDVAFLSGASKPTGTITFRLYGPDDPTCSGSPVFEAEQTVVGTNGFYPSPTFRAHATGTYLWTATYSGDTNNAGAATGCGDAHESTVVLPRPPLLTTSASPPAFLREGRRVRAAGLPIYDSARLAGSFHATGELTFDLYGPDDAACSGAPSFSASTAVNGDGVYNSAQFTPTAPGTYRWRATYSGDSNNDPAGPTSCDDPAEQVQVTVPADPQLTTSASQAVTLRGAIHDTAHLSDGADPTGTITFKLYGAGDTGCSGGPVFKSTVTVNGNGDYPSASYVPTRAGAYRWVAVYSGDARNNAAGPTACGDPAETAIVRPPSIIPVTPTFSTTAGQQPAGGSTVFDTGFLSGGIAPGGAITFELFGPDDTTCSGTPVFVTTTAVSGNGDYRSASFAVPAPGTYRWVDTYSGDAMNAGVGPTACGNSAETVSVSGTPAPQPDPGPDVPTPSQPRPPHKHKPSHKPNPSHKPKPKPKPTPPPPKPIVTG